MNIDWSIVLQVSVPIVTLFIGAFLNRYLENRERLIVYYGYIASHIVRAQNPQQQDIAVFTHSIILRNTGTKSAKNVRVGHRQLDNFRVDPDIEYEKRTLPNGTKEIVFPTIVPKKEISISYLYYPPTTYAEINTHVESDEGPAKVVNVRLQQVFSKWVQLLVAALLILGSVTATYFLISGFIWLLHIT